MRVVKRFGLDNLQSGLAVAVALVIGSMAIAGSAQAQSGEAAGKEHDRLVGRGVEVFQRCSACHRIGVEAENRIGPQLNNLIGRKAGTVKGARYSPAMVRAGAEGLVWTPETIDAFVADPKGFIEGTTMGLRGVDDADDRKALIAYLASFSTGPSNIPETPVPPRAGVDAGLPTEILALKGDAEFGEYLSGECVTCHQASGEDKGIPSIVGWPPADFVIAMHGYKSKKREHPVMRMIAGRLSAEEIAALAAYFNKKGQ
ncbi:MAG: c-type cytochrome [Alphaproteobacteria bacterium]|nr:c-type cytochrome [Alphaproteobacteria bacterium]